MEQTAGVDSSPVEARRGRSRTALERAASPPRLRFGRGSRGVSSHGSDDDGASQVASQGASGGAAVASPSGVSRVLRGVAARLRPSLLGRLGGRRGARAGDADPWDLFAVDEDGSDGVDEASVRPTKRVRRVVEVPTTSEDE